MVFVPTQVYRFQKSIVNPTAVTNLQLKAPATGSLVILGYGALPTTAVTTSTTWSLQLGRIPTTFGTMTIAVSTDLQKESQGYAASTVPLGTSATGFTATGEPTYTDTWFKGGNALSPIEEVFIPELRKVIQASTGIGLKTVLAPPAGTYLFYIDYGELV